MKVDNSAQNGISDVPALFANLVLGLHSTSLLAAEMKTAFGRREAVRAKFARAKAAGRKKQPK